MMNLRGKVTKSKLGGRERVEKTKVGIAFRGYMHLMAFFMSPTFTPENAPRHDELLWHFGRLLKPSGWEHLSHFQIKFLKDYCDRNNYERWF